MGDTRGDLRISPQHSSMAGQASPGYLKTSPTIYMGPISPGRRKFSNDLQAASVRCPDQQPKSPLAPPGAAIQGDWVPFSLVPLPPKLAFATWWNEGKERVHMHVTYDTVTRQCTAGTSLSVAAEVTTSSGRCIDEYDVHVGAELRILGRKVTLKKAVTLATLKWLDQQAAAMLVAKYRLEQELAKFRPVVPVSGQYEQSQRAESFDLATHQHLPAGGRLNLRALYDCIVRLAQAVRQHRARLPPLPAPVSIRGGALRGPPDWSPERLAAEKEAAETQRRIAAQQALDAQQHADDKWRHDLLQWVDSIPLAVSCCAKHQPEQVEELPEPPGTAGKGKAGGGRPPRAAGMAGSRELSLNYSMINRHGLASASGERAGSALARQSSGNSNSGRTSRLRL